ncbi:purine-cytosine permease family protein [Paraburkholderia silviterrae]|uniref:Cytosine permease n=1 Tax=Paraburkholderia silviterrae TaxID=2528715 RepID=A0A4R5M481_9BURK|nr:cytosine permease [Paraburkholderia silviterrae]TDG20577.1 cytosine permease [Paraburkholderia silviterrae]
MQRENRHHPDAEVRADKAWSIEQHAIEPIPPADRHGTPAELFKMWLGANINYVVVVTGALVLALGLSVWQALGAILVGNVLGCAVLGLTTIMGPRTGTSGIMTSRSAFGQLGSFLPKSLSLVSALSWFSINSIVATQALETLLKLTGWHGHGVIWVSLAIILAAEILLAIFGHATIIAAEKWIAVVLAVLFGALAAFVAPHVDFAVALAGRQNGASFGTWLIAMGIVFAYPISWCNFASDYSRYFPSETSWKKLMLASGGGQFVALVFCEVIGVLCSTALGGALGDDPVSQLSRFLPTWFTVPLLGAIILGGIAVNVPNGYTAGLGLLALRIPINRVTSLTIIAVFTLVVRVVTVYYGQFYDLYQGFLNYMVFWTAPWAAIVIVDYFLRNGRYRTDAWMQWGSGAYWYRHGIFWPGVIALVAGTAASVLFSNSTTYVSPLMRDYLGWGDLSFEFGLLFAGATYYLLARQHPALRWASPTERASTDTQAPLV